MKAFAPLLALVAATFAFTTPAAADDMTVRADLNGDGQLDSVTIRPVAGNPNLQRLVAVVGGTTLRATVPLDAYQVGVQPLRVVDLDDDGWDEVVVTETVGANTLSFTVWGLFGGLRPVVGPDLVTPLRLWEGGGISATSLYGCEADGGGRQLVLTGGYAIDVDFEVFQGERVTYTVHNGVAAETSRIEVTSTRDDPAFQADPAACA
jgi:hypothetical protein